jgi:hypothetical protein
MALTKLLVSIVSVLSENGLYRLDKEQFQDEIIYFKKSLGMLEYLDQSVLSGEIMESLFILGETKETMNQLINESQFYMLQRQKRNGSFFKNGEDGDEDEEEIKKNLPSLQANIDGVRVALNLFGTEKHDREIVNRRVPHIKYIRDIKDRKFMSSEYMLYYSSDRYTKLKILIKESQ